MCLLLNDVYLNNVFYAGVCWFVLGFTTKYLNYLVLSYVNFLHVLHIENRNYYEQMMSFNKICYAKGKRKNAKRKQKQRLTSNQIQ